MSRRTYRQAVAWRAAAVALLAEVTEVQVTTNPQGGHKTPHDRLTGEQKIVLGKGQIVTYLSGKVSIGGPAEEADYLCEPLARHGLLEGWQSGSRGLGVTWTVPVLTMEADGLRGQISTRPETTIGELIAAVHREVQHDSVEDRLRAWRDELALGPMPGRLIGAEIDRRFPELARSERA